jgi:hypothetical protein
MNQKRWPSNASTPDLDWSQVRETVMMLNLAVAQIERSMMDGEDSVTALAEMFTSMADNVQAIGKAAHPLSESGEKHAIEENFRNASAKVNTAIVAFQFYDKLAQRLSHVSYSLASLAELIGDPEKLYNPRQWTGLQDLIKSKYTIASDKKMFDAILDGLTVEQVLDMNIKNEEQDAAPGDDIELF